MVEHGALGRGRERLRRRVHHQAADQTGTGSLFPPTGCALAPYYATVCACVCVFFCAAAVAVNRATAPDASRRLSDFCIFFILAGSLGISRQMEGLVSEVSRITPGRGGQRSILAARTTAARLHPPPPIHHHHPPTP